MKKQSQMIRVMPVLLLALMFGGTGTANSSQVWTGPTKRLWHKSLHYISANGLLYRSSPDVVAEGFGWAEIQQNITSFTVFRDPSDEYADILYAIRYGRLAKSLDAGQSWMELRNVPAGLIEDIAVNPRNPQVAAVIIDAALYTTSDGGLSWGKSATPCPILFVYWQDSDPQILWIAGSAVVENGRRGVVYSSQDQGASWTDSSSGLPLYTQRGTGRTTVMTRPLPSSMCALGKSSERLLLALGTEIYMRIAAGDWMHVEIPFPPKSEPHLVRGQEGPAFVYSTNKSGAIVLLSTEDGSLWSPVLPPKNCGVIQSISSSSKVTMIIDSENRVFYRACGMESFRAQNFGPNIRSNMLAISIVPDSLRTFLAFLQGNDAMLGKPSAGIFSSPDEGETWENRLPLEPSDVREQFNNVRFQVAPNEPRVIWAMWTLEGLLPSRCLYVSRDGGVNWHKVAPPSGGPSNGETTFLEYSPTDGKTLYRLSGVNELSVFRSSDDGLTWTNMSESTETYGGELIVNRTNGSLIMSDWHSDLALHISTDGGWSWRKVDLVQIKENVGGWAGSTIRPVYARGDSILLLYTRGSSSTGWDECSELWLSSDGGRSWSKRREFITDAMESWFRRRVDVFHVQETAGGIRFWVRWTFDENGKGVYGSRLESSDDFGANWRQVQEPQDYKGFQSSWMASFPHDNNALFLATPGGVFRSDEGSGSWVEFIPPIDGCTEPSRGASMESDLGESTPKMSEQGGSATANGIMEGVVEEAGGRERVRAVESSVIEWSGVYWRDGRKWPIGYTYVQTRTGCSWILTDLGQRSTLRCLCGEDAWEDTGSGQGPMDASSKSRLLQSLERTFIHVLTSYRELDMSLEGETVIDGKDLYVLRARESRITNWKLYVDKASRQITREEYDEVDTNGQNQHTTLLLKDFKEIQGIVMPHRRVYVQRETVWMDLGLRGGAFNERVDAKLLRRCPR